MEPSNKITRDKSGAIINQDYTSLSEYRHIKNLNRQRKQTIEFYENKIKYLEERLDRLEHDVSMLKQTNGLP